MKQIVMTAEEEQRIRADASDSQTESLAPGWAARQSAQARVLLAEIDALRRLPVIVGTYECAHHDRETCRHPRRVRITCDEPSPHAVCPLRSAS